METRLRNYLSNIKKFTGAVLIAKDDEIIFKEAFGLACDGVQNTTKSNFGIGSVTKSFTALSIMQLVEKNKLKLNDKVIDFFEEIYPDAKITIHHLLNQTSGIPNYLFDKRVQTGDDFTPEQIIDLVLEKPLKFQPGKKWQYSNTNYLLLAQIIETVTNQSFHEYVTEHILLPAGMENSFFDGEKEDNKAQYWESVFHCKPSLLLGAGDLVSNVEDLFLYDQALSSDRLATTESIKKMQSISYDGTLVKYGYGWFIKNNFGRQSISHGGFHPIGYTSHFEKFVEENLTIIVLSNKLQKNSPLGVKYFNSTDLGREIGARAFGKTAFPWQKFN
ncbi:serine hydrolase domain-containing protein [Anaerobacillus isosaccharinicus]|uniref:Beta-lactamase family protein n=1 Tax=Anaerobacillus isosaccharinicus TaxID=1532552 RepID=A0A1S2LIX2_9BACI|nr:serine hydrolase domain-containing protein [Anaerobacillus isosaccharinicus]MBA5586153.1 beta-lactamase family protein [Anaerobacillus isosaccharinicus]QOY35581.1 beta-lactamase family protein [Anaerobacillus isosaccharinicus]